MIETIEDDYDLFEPIQKLSKDIKTAIATLPGNESRYLVDAYYQKQKDRIRSGNIIKQAEKTGEPHSFVVHVHEQNKVLESQIRTAMKIWAESQRPGRWMLSQYGVGPVTAAGLLAHIDIHKAPTVGHIWSFAGLNPNAVWEKGQRRPWNAELKTLCWKIGECFTKFSANEKCYYGHLYLSRKAQEVENNNALKFADQAKKALETKTIKDADLRKCLESGKLPDGQIHTRAQRYAVKLFLSHLHHVWYECEFNSPPPKPYVIEHLGHVHLMSPPGWPCE